VPSRAWTAISSPRPGEPADELDREADAARRAGLEVEKVARAPLGSFDTGPALRFPRQAQFHPLRYLSGLANAVLAAGGQIYTDVHVEEFEGGAKAHVKTATGRQVACKVVVVATNTPVNDRVVIHTKQAPYRTYVVGVEVPAGSVEKALFWDTADPYHYVRTQAQESGRPDLLIVGGEDHRTGQADDAEERWTRLERWTRERFPHGPGRDLQVVGPGARARGRPRLHRPQSAGQRQRLHRHRATAGRA
jgi:glycine/D-amino acid oxidase-like deaminating enzyme